MGETREGLRQSALTGVVIAVILAGPWVASLVKPSVPVGPLDIGASVAASAAMPARRRWPLAVLLGATLLCFVYYPLSALDGPLVAALFLALYTAADRGRVLPSLLLTVAALAAIGVEELRGDLRHVDDSMIMLVGGWMLAAVAIGGVTHNHRAYLREAEQRVRAAEHGKEEEARRRALEERLRIARDLHDVLGHNLSLINVQAGAALHRLADHPEQAAPALATIKETSRDTLRELRATLGVLRQGDPERPPGLAGLGELIGRCGLDVRTDVAGELTGLPPEVDTAAARIVQEALTNVARHSGVRAATVRIRRSGGTLLVEVDDEGHGTPCAPGYGITGMRERAAALGGTLTAGPRPGGGFRVAAEIPCATNAPGV
ncbi:sensor histidine kinase [Spongiactinospora rosea]|uniref:histidine kinase n=1 Tax=Spongiactinospora rosea TaxID=2248750 RepID=A0A366LP46_9ACTN|nr:sensor histidine kinase [Spongiactinospora rosea]RBQ15617.1 sensor histidine kinase [Spongiactinospora rosea]